MKELYSFDIERTINKEIPIIKKNKKGEPVESNKTVTEKIINRIAVAKPNFADIENGEFFYGQKYNEFINAGFLTKAMMNKRIGDIGGSSSKLSQEIMNKAFLDYMDSAKVIEFYEGHNDLEEDQKSKLEEAKIKFFEAQKTINDFETSYRNQYSQTADAKAEQKIIEWFIFNFSYYEEKVDGQKQLFPIFEGDNYEQKRDYYLLLCEDIEFIEDTSLLKNKAIFDKSFIKLVQVINVWYNKLASSQDDIDKKMKEIFADE